MRKSIVTFIFMLIVSSVFSQQKTPKLIVGIVVDQMRDEYLDRFYNDFGDTGFKRLMKDGYRMKNFHFNYMPTYTAPGHASIYTGTTPRYHGIVGNGYYLRQEHRGVYCTDDDSVSLLGNGDPKYGKMSPSRLKSTTVTDELKMSSNFRSKVIGISIKDRSSILPAGHFADWAFWMNKDGEFISSTFYGDKLPEWVENFNSEKYYEKYLKKNWSLLKDIKEYDESLPDSNPYEGKLNYKLEPVFPYNLYDEYKKNGASIIKVTPWGNSILVDLAEEAIENENLGKDEFTDFLALSFSSTDYIGHAMGPRSIELQDMYLRLDILLGEFLEYLDKNIGKGNYMVFLTADHACGENPNFLKDNKFNVTNLDRKEIKKQITEISKQLYGVNLLESYNNQNLYFDLKKIDSLGLSRVGVYRKFQEKLEEWKFVKRAYVESELLGSSVDFLHNEVANGYDVKQNGQIVLLFEPGYMEYWSTGTSHGTPYGYDTHVPGLFYGWNIPSGINYDKHYITEIAPTVSQLLHITLPNSSKNEVITELLHKGARQ